MWKKIIIAAVALPIAGVVIYFSLNVKTMTFESVCNDKTNDKYDETLCSNVGKRAHNLYSMDALNDKDYGPIIGVAWRKKGSIISSPGRAKRYSENNSYYYIIGSDTSNYQFLRTIDEIAVK